VVTPDEGKWYKKLGFERRGERGLSAKKGEGSPYSQNRTCEVVYIFSTATEGRMGHGSEQTRSLGTLKKNQRWLSLKKGRMLGEGLLPQTLEFM